MSDRDTHFLGFAKLLYEELAKNVLASGKELSDIKGFRQEQYGIIARRAYDLVKHTIESTSHHNLDVLSSDEHVARIPDLTKWETNE